jgi:hypothetical protein
MRFSRFIAVAGAVVFALWCMPGVQAAGPVFKCQGPGGKLTFSDQPCPNEQKQETVKAAPPPGQVDVGFVCGPSARATTEFSLKATVCSQMRKCADNKGDVACHVYCTPFAGSESAVPGVKFGPASPSCLRYNDYIGGKNWVQTSARSNDGTTHDVIPASCVDANGRTTRPVFLVCEAGTTKCSTERPQRGRRVSATTPVEELMTKTCSS